MANEKIKQNYKDIANAIRAKTGENGLITAEEMPSKIEGIPTPEGTTTITTNGTHDVTEFAVANVNVPNPSTGTLNITENGNYDVTEKAGVNVNVEGYPEPSGTEYIYENGEHYIKDYEYVNVDVSSGDYIEPGILQAPDSFYASGYSQYAPIQITDTGILYREGEWNTLSLAKTELPTEIDEEVVVDAGSRRFKIICIA